MNRVRGVHLETGEVIELEGKKAINDAGFKSSMVYQVASGSVRKEKCSRSATGYRTRARKSHGGYLWQYLNS